MHWSLIVVYVLSAVIASGHALLSKREPQAALGWIGVCMLFPVGGVLFYYLFGINRVRTRARKLRRRVDRERGTRHKRLDIAKTLLVAPEYSELARISDAVTGLALTEGNEVVPLQNGESAYPAMLSAIASARQRVYMATYIFDTDATGRQFIDALAAAAARGVEVRVLIDGIGERYSYPLASELLRQHGVSVERFNPPRMMPLSVHINLRNHRKILVVDGLQAFTGGMNIGGNHLVKQAGNKAPVADLHFALRGPVVGQIEHVFIADWAFACGEMLTSSETAPPQPDGAMCRALVGGPDEDLGHLEMVLVGAVSAARERVAIMTPYFLPGRELSAALEVAALRGVDVTIVLPELCNLPYVQWATRHMLPELLRFGVHVYWQPPPFAHTKLLLVDDHYVQIGSANLDPRSLRLNFELVVEVYDRALGRGLRQYVDSIVGAARACTRTELARRPLPVRLRDALIWLFSPYL